MFDMFTVVKFTFRNRFRSKSFLVMSIILALIITVMINFPAIIDKLSMHEPAKIGVFQDDLGIANKLQSYFQKQENAEIVVVPLQGSGSPQDEAAAKSQIKAKKIKGYLQFVEKDAAGFPEIVYKSEGSMEFSTKSILQSALQQVKSNMAVAEAGLSEEQMKKIFDPITLDTLQISMTDKKMNQGKTEGQMQMAYALVYVLLLLLYIGVIGYGNMVAMEITAEKSSRVMEVLISSVSPLRQMFGKIIGICLLGLVQIAIFMGVALINVSMPQNKDMLQRINLDWSQLPLSLLVYFLIFYIMGYLIYATLFAAVGSIVSRTEDVGQAIMPITFLIVGGFMIAMYGLQQPNAAFVVGMSFVPFFTPLIMFLRIGMSDPAVWEIWLSIAILLTSILGIGWLSARIYRTGVLMYGKRPSFKELRKAMKSYKF